MSEEQKCREAFNEEYPSLTGEKRAHAWSVWTAAWNCRQQVPEGYMMISRSDLKAWAKDLADSAEPFDRAAMAICALAADPPREAMP